MAPNGGALPPSGRLGPVFEYTEAELASWSRQKVIQALFEYGLADDTLDGVEDHDRARLLAHFRTQQTAYEEFQRTHSAPGRPVSPPSPLWSDCAGTPDGCASGDAGSASDLVWSPSGRLVTPPRASVGADGDDPTVPFGAGFYSRPSRPRPHPIGGLAPFPLELEPEDDAQSGNFDGDLAALDARETLAEGQVLDPADDILARQHGADSDTGSPVSIPDDPR